MAPESNAPSGMAESGDSLESTDHLDRRFPETSWTLLGKAGLRDLAGIAAREEFARRYWLPVRSYFAALTRDIQRSDDLAQSFFVRVTANESMLRSAAPQLGRFRHYLKRSLRNFLISELRRDGALTRGVKDEVRPDAAAGDGWAQLALASDVTPEVEFDRAWIRGLIDNALVQVRRDCIRKDQSLHFELFYAWYFGAAGETGSWAALGAPHGLDEKGTRSRAETVVRQLRQLIRSRIREETGGEAHVDDELAALRRLL